MSVFFSKRYLSTQTQNYFKRVLKTNLPSQNNKDFLRKDVRESQENQEVHDAKLRYLVNKQKHVQFHSLKDYELEDYKVDGALPSSVDYIGDIKGKIPKDKIEASRNELEIVDNLLPNHEVALFNLPYDTTLSEVTTIAEKYGDVANIKLFPNTLGAPSHAVISFQASSSLEACKLDYNKVWFRNRLLKVRTHEDAELESIRNRTLLVQNIPQYILENGISKNFSKFGSILKIDLPMTDRRIQKLKDDKPEPESQRRIARNYTERMNTIDKYFMDLDPYLHTPEERAQARDGNISTTSDLLKTEKDIHTQQNSKNVLTAASSNSNILRKTQYQRTINLGALLYSENKEVGESIKDLQVERESLMNRMNNHMQYPEEAEKAANQSFITDTQIESLRNLMEYVKRNSDSVPPEFLSELAENKVLESVLNYNQKHGNGKIHKSKVLTPQVLSESLTTQVVNSHTDVLKEMASGYEHLLHCLERREKVLKIRLDRLMKDYGRDDRIIQEKQDPNNELDSLDYNTANRSDYNLKIEDIISVSDQIKNISNWKKENTLLNHDDKVNGISELSKPNFNTNDLMHMKLNEKSIQLVEKFLPKRGGDFDRHNLKNKNIHGHTFEKDAFENVILQVEEQKWTLDTPLDELYHKEKAVIDNVARAHRELNEAREQQIAELERSSGSVEHLYDESLNHLLENDDGVRTLLKNQQFSTEGGKKDTSDDLFSTLKQVKDSHNDTFINSMNTLTNNYTSRLEKFTDQISNMQNLGYCFITFSHADEAKKCLVSDEFMHIDTQIVKLSPKGDISHEDLNHEYARTRTMLDSKNVEKQENLHEAQQKLKDFEEDFESHMPMSFKLNSMKKAALDSIDENHFYDRNMYPRSLRDDKRLKYKVKDFERQTGHSMSPLLENEELELHKINKHRKAFDTYKSYAFLKAGMDKTQLEKQLSEETTGQDEYKFPSSDEVARNYIHNKPTYGLLDEGEENISYGRKFSYNAKDYIESYFGKDLQRQNFLPIGERKIYNFNDEMRKEYSYDSLSQVPNIRKKVNRNKEDTDYYVHNQHPDLDDKKRILESKSVNFEVPIDATDTPNPLVKGKKADRLRRYQKNMTELNEEGIPRWNNQRMRLAMRDENMDYDKEGLERRLRQIENKQQRIRDLKNKDAAPQTEEVKPQIDGPVDDNPGEKWKPSKDDSSDAQPSRDKVYAEYIDSEKAEYLRSSDGAGYNTFDSKFAEYYEKGVLKPNINKNDGELFKLQPEFSAHSRDINSRVGIEEFNYAKERYYQKLTARRKYLIEKNNIGSQPRHKTKLKELKIDPEMLHQIDMLRDGASAKNEEFIYRRKYNKDNKPDEKDITENEESAYFRQLRNEAVTEKELDELSRISKSQKYLTERDYSDNFLHKLKEGSIDEGLKIRQDKLAVQQDKTLSEIVHSQDPNHQNIYNKYMSHKEETEQADKESRIQRREDAFTKAAVEDHQKYSLKHHDTFQKYEDYKKTMKQESNKEFAYSKEDTKRPRMTRREWAAKVWANKVSPKEFEDYMYVTSTKLDKHGIERKNFQQLKHPGFGKEFVTTEDKVRLSQELKEQKRRTAVMDGQVSEEDSYDYIELYHQQAVDSLKYSNGPTFKKIYQESLLFEYALNKGNSTREYYFDSSQGVTLEQHIEAVKRTNPEAEVTHTIDNDGFTIVKRVVKKKYKYNVDELINNNSAKLMERIKQKIRKISEESSFKLQNEEDIFQFMNHQEQIQSSFFKEVQELSTYFEGAIEDHERFTEEIVEQLRIKFLRHKYFHKLDEKDFVKLKQPETIIMENLKESYENSILNYEDSLRVSDSNNDYLTIIKKNNKSKYEALKDKEDFEVLSKDDYKQLKKSIKERKEAKANLLKQGFPKLKNYVYL